MMPAVQQVGNNAGGVRVRRCLCLRAGWQGETGTCSRNCAPQRCCRWRFCRRNRRCGDLDGDTLFWSAPRGDDDNGSESGSAYIFTRSGTAWTEQAKLLPALTARQDEWFGWDSVELDGAIRR